MKPVDVKKLMISSLAADANSEDIMRKLEGAGVKYSFGDDFRDKILLRIFSAAETFNREVEFLKSMNSIFYRIALTGVAAIVILLISIFLTQGSLSFNSVLGLSNSYDESIVCLLTGN